LRTLTTNGLRFSCHPEVELFGQLRDGVWGLVCLRGWSVFWTTFVVGAATLFPPQPPIEKNTRKHINTIGNHIEPVDPAKTREDNGVHPIQKTILVLFTTAVPGIHTANGVWKAHGNLNTANRFSSPSGWTSIFTFFPLRVNNVFSHIYMCERDIPNYKVLGS